MQPCQPPPLARMTLAIARSALVHRLCIRENVRHVGGNRNEVHAFLEPIRILAPNALPQIFGGEIVFFTHL